MHQMMHLLVKMGAEAEEDDANPHLPELPFLQATLANVYAFFSNAPIPTMARYYELQRDPQDFAPHKTQKCLKQKVLRLVRTYLPEAKKSPMFLWFCRIFLRNSIRHWPSPP